MSTLAPFPAMDDPMTDVTDPTFATRLAGERSMDLAGTSLDDLPVELVTQIFDWISPVGSPAWFERLLRSENELSSWAESEEKDPRNKPTLWSVSQRSLICTSKRYRNISKDYPPVARSFSLNEASVRRILGVKSDVDLVAYMTDDDTRNTAIEAIKSSKLDAESVNDMTIILVPEYRDRPALRDLITAFFTLSHHDSSLLSKVAHVGILWSDHKVQRNRNNPARSARPGDLGSVDWKSLTGDRVQFHHYPHPDHTAWLDDLPSWPKLSVYSEKPPRYENGSELSGVINTHWYVPPLPTAATDWQVRLFLEDISRYAVGFKNTGPVPARGNFIAHVTDKSRLERHRGLSNGLKESFKVTGNRLKKKGLGFRLGFDYRGEGCE